MDEIKPGIPGMVCKAASLSAGEVTDKQLAKINKYTLEPLTAEQVFVFKAVLCDNMVDRDFEKFSAKAIDDLRNLYIGKTVIKNHNPSTDNQIARIYDTELVKGELLPDGEQYTQLIAHCYMVKTAGNADMIAEILGGIRKEGSISCAVKKCICSVCGADNRKAYCQHWRGKRYDGKDCYFTLDGAKDAYEFSLVAVPAQKAAGISKSYTGETIYDQPQESPADDIAQVLRQRVRLLALRTGTKEEQ